MQNIANNQGPTPPIPNGATQFRPQTPQNPVSSSPFANPPPETPTNNQNIRPASNPIAVRPPMPTHQSPSAAPMTANRPPMTRPPMTNGARPPASATQPTPNGVPATMRPPIPQSPSTQGVKTPVPQSVPGPYANPPITQNVSPQMARPPMTQTPRGPPTTSPQTNQISPVMRPPLQASNNVQASPLQGSRPPMMQATQTNAPPRPTMSQSPQSTASARPPMHQSPQVSGPYSRPPAVPQAQASRPPMPMRPPVPATQSPSAPMRPPVPTVPATRPPMSTPQPQMNTQATASPMQTRPPMPGNPGFNQPVNQMPHSSMPVQQAAPVVPQIPVARSPSMRYPAGPGYMQQQQPPVHPAMQQQQPPVHPAMQQQSAYPQTQQHYPSYPQAPNAQNLHQYPNQSYSGGSLAPQQPAAPKVNPAAIPSVVAVLEADELRFKETGQPFYTFSSIVDHPPPLPTTRSVSIVDDGNSSPQFIRSTLNHVPISEEICENTKIPLSLIIQPFANSPQNDVPLVDFGAAGPLRCNRCRAYINPHVQFIKGGRFYVCNLCDMSNEVPDEYYANLDMSGKRIDLDLRPELKYGTVDFVATKEYMNRPAGKPHLLFVLDSSRAAVGSGAFQAALESIKAFTSSAQAVQYYGGMCILTHDRTLTFYTLREGRNEPQVYVMGDIFDPFVPLHANDLYFDPIKCTSGLSVLLNHLSTSMTLDSRPVDSSFGAAVSVALESLKVRGGRAIFFQTALPSYGPGALNNREMGSAAAPADKANPLLFPQGDFYSKLAVQAAEQGISMSIVSTPAAHIDLATLGILANTTSGTVLHYSRFTVQQQMSRLVGDVLGLLSNSFAFDILARIRCNSGLQVKKHYGHFYAAQNGHDLNFGTIASDQSFAALLEYDGKLSEKERSSFQVAFLYTDAFSGQRRIRVLNLALPCTSSIQTIFRMAELDSILSLHLKKNVSQILEAPASAFPASFTAKCVNILAAYRRYCAANMSSGQLILPDSLKLFPIMTLAIHKDPAFNTAPTSIDSRWHAIHRLSDLSLPLTISYFYPQLFPLSNILEHEEILPACLRLSREHLSRDGIYLMNDGYNLTLYIGDAVDPNILKEIFGVTQLNAVNLISSSSTSSNLQILQNARSAKIRQIITVLRSQNLPRHLNLRLVRQSVDIAEDAEFANMLVEDASSNTASYVDFLCRVHSQIQHTISQGSTLSLAERTSILSFLQ